ncbi:MAG: ParE family toxin-like protein [Ktedonobacterales bacterium]
MKSLRTAQFRKHYAVLPPEIQRKADEAYQLFRQDPDHPSLHFKKVDDGDPELWSVRIGRRYRALGLRRGDWIAWVWIGTHREYEERI